MQKSMKWLSMHGYLTIMNSSAGMYLTDYLMRWTVELDIRIPDGTKITERGEDLESVMDMVVQEAIMWFTRFRPEYLSDKPMVMNLKDPFQ